jgi:signal peptidase I
VTEPPENATAQKDLPAEAQGPKDQLEPKGKRSFLRELPVLLLVAFVLALLIKTFLVQAFYIPSGSMEDTLIRGDRVLVNRVVYRLHPPRRGDVIVFSDPHVQADRGAVSAFWHWLTSGFGLPGGEEDFIKRVIGLPGETVEIKDCVVYVDGLALKERYVTPANNRAQCSYGPVRVPKDSLFVLGDNRDHSGDSRFGLGFIPFDKVIGRAFVVLWPPSRMGWLRGS